MSTEVTNPFDLLAPDIQRTLIDICIKEKKPTITYENNVYELPNLLQLTYFCKKDSQSYPIRVYRTDLLAGVSEIIKCPKCNKEIYCVHKTVPLDYALIKLGSSAKDISDFLGDE